MLLIFRNRFSKTYLTFNIDRPKKLLVVTGEHGNYQPQELPWRYLWDKCEFHKIRPRENNRKCELCNEVTERQDKETEVMNDPDFVKVFEDQMQLYDYELKKWEQ